jgi:signal transduction histidine kinase/ligand-binding sensor domain-containing protein/DNA-binding response OmpR family regulator
MKKYFLLGLIFLGIHITLSANKITIQNLNEKYGLVKKRVNCMFQDSKGFIWFGMVNGLYKFDQCSFTSLSSRKSAANSFPETDISSIIEIKPGLLLIGTFDKGLWVYDSELMKTYSVVSDSAVDFSKLNIKCLYKDNSGVIWVGTYKGLYWIKCIGKTLNKFKVQMVANNYCKDCADRDIVNIKESESGIIWYATMISIGYYNPVTKKNRNIFLYEAISSFEFLGKNKILVGGYGNGLKIVDTEAQTVKKVNIKGISAKSFVTCVYKDADSNIWFGVSNEGLYFIGPDLEKPNLMLVSNKDNQYANLNSNTILQINKSNDGTLWACTEDGINTILLSKNYFQFYPCNISDRNLTQLVGIRSLINSTKGFLWAGTVGDGLKKFDLTTKTFEKVNLINQGKKIGNFIQTMMLDSRGEIWLGTGGEGVIRYNPDKNSKSLMETMVNYRVFPQSFPTKTILNDFVMCILEDRHKNIWIGTWHGLSLIDSSDVVKTDQSQIVIQNFLNNPMDSLSISNNTIMSLLEDREGNIWVGTKAGLNKIVKTKEGYKFQNHFKSKNGDFLSQRSILCTYQSKNGKIWFSSQEGGLYFLDPGKAIFQELDLDNVFFENIITSIVENEKGELWLGSNSGLCCLDQNNYTFKIYTTEDGLTSNDFLFASNCKAGKNLCFGVNSGLIMFNPLAILYHPFNMNLKFTEFRLFNKTVYPNSNGSPLKHHISIEKNITLKYNQNFFTIFFASINYKRQNEVHYAYILDGLETSWNDLKRENWATYTNLSPGKYIFKVKAFSSNDYTNTSEISLRITIKPPFWKTTGAYIFYLFGLIILLIQTYQFFLRKEKRRNALTLERLNAKRIHEIDLMRLQFFTNISHEFRTPLTLISAPVDTLIKEKPESSKAEPYYHIISRNVQRLTKLIDQLLDFRKIEEGYLKVVWEPGDIVEFTQKTFNTFKYYAEKRNIDFTFQSESPELFTFFDSDKLDKILFNLFSNAFKYTPDKGSIAIKLAEKSVKEIPIQGITDQYLEIKITDSGVGIPTEYIDKIFKPFQQVDTNKPVGSKATGIGLALTKEFIDLHNGFILVESKLDNGTTFTIYLPVYKSNPDGTTKVDSVIFTEDTAELEYNDVPENIERFEERAAGHKPLVLVVEDNTDMRAFLRNELQRCFQIIESNNGKDGLALAIENIPDLVVSDVMMDKMDGIELCRQLKSDERTSHIPIILLTARHADDVKLSGYEIGADDYITKPFNMSLLVSRIKNLIEQRRKLSKRFKKEYGNDKEIVPNKLDSQFLMKLNNFIENNMANPHYEPVMLAKDMGMSRMQLYRKVAAITNETVNSYIRTVRLNKAAHLLLSTDLQIADISLAVGYTEPTNFTRSFLKQFNQTPTQFRTSRD